jgi:hypothetical protein
VLRDAAAGGVSELAMASTLRAGQGRGLSAVNPAAGSHRAITPWAR